MAILERGESAMSECVMCSHEIKTNKPVVIFTDTLFNPNGRWSEHLNRDTLCSVECLIQLLQDDEGNWLSDEGSVETEDGAQCSCCDSHFDMGHQITLGWHKTKSARWHKVVTTRSYCGHACLTQDLDNTDSPVHMSIGTKPRKKSKKRRKK